jgi:tagatose 1,6-diphosphate aldolase GatY/KbaY
MLVPFADLLQSHQRRRTALCAFTCYNLETAFGVLQAAQTCDVGVVLLVSEQALRSPHGVYLLTSLRAMAEYAPIPVCVQLDHVSDLALVSLAFEFGVGAVMADGSRLPFEQNVALVREATVLAQRYGGGVEAELGRIEGDEDLAIAASAGTLTDPEQAAAFVQQAYPVCLAVSIGNVHGVYRYPPVLDWERLQKIRSLVNVPLSLHGASGLANGDLEQAVALGIAKVNFNTELRLRYLEATVKELDNVMPGARILELNMKQAAAVAAVAADKIALCAMPTTVTSREVPHSGDR